MTNHVVSDQLYTGEFAAIRDAYRLGEGNSTIRAECDNQVLIFFMWSCYLRIVCLLGGSTMEAHGSA